MPALLRLTRWIDRLNEGVGRLAGWVTLAMVLVGAYNAVARYAGRWAGTRLTSNALIELQWYGFALVFLLGAGWALRHGAHVRVDVLYGRLSARAQTWTDLLGGVLLLVPFVALVLWVSWAPVAQSWALGEVSPDPGGLPRWPIKAVVLAGFALLLLQGLAEIARAAARLVGALPMEPHAPAAETEGGAA